MSKTMKVWKVVGPHQIEMSEAPIVENKDNEVLLKILCFGICASDMQIYNGKHKYAAMPVIMGHEVSAEIVAVGSKVEGFSVGEKVTVEPQVFCGECYPCKQGRFNVCEKLRVYGVHVDGFNLEYSAVEPKYLHKVPNTLTDEQIALVEPLAVGVGSIKRSQTFKGGNVVVVGAGVIGNFVAQAAKGLGAGQVLVVDISDDKLEYAKECGIDFAINTSKTPLKEAIVSAFGDRKADVIVDCVAIPPVFLDIIDAARPNSEIIVTGNFKAPVSIELPMIQRREINIIGHMMYVREDFADAISLLNDGKITISKTITQTYKFEEYKEALDFINDNPLDVMKAIVKL